MSATIHISRTVVATLTMLLGHGVYSQEPSFYRVFGPGPDYNNTTLVMEDGSTMKHDSTTCTVERIDDNGKAIWTTDLSAYGCMLMYFGKVSEGKVKGCDILVQFEDKRICGIRMKTGKLKLLPQEDVDLMDKRSKSKPVK